jgi:hypothetical protein
MLCGSQLMSRQLAAAATERKEEDQEEEEEEREVNGPRRQWLPTAR